jgi:Ankyrin repeats (3 copies)
MANGGGGTFVVSLSHGGDDPPHTSVARVERASRRSIEPSPRKRMLLALTAHPRDWLTIALVMQEPCDWESREGPLSPNELSTAVVLAARAGGESIVGLLLARGASVNKCSEALRACAEWRRGYVNVARVLLNYGVEDGDGMEVLRMAVRYGHTELVALLLARGVAEVNAMNAVQATALHVAAKFGRKSVAVVLLCFGANPTAVNARGETAEKVAERAPGGPEMIPKIFRLCELLFDDGIDKMELVRGILANNCKVGKAVLELLGAQESYA